MVVVTIRPRKHTIIFEGRSPHGVRHVVEMAAAEQMWGRLGAADQGANARATGHVRLVYQRSVRASFTIDRSLVVKMLSWIGVFHRAAS